MAVTPRIGELEACMYRQRIHVTVKDGDGWNTVLDINKQMNAIADRLGQAQASVWTLSVGIFNELVFEIDYVSLAEFEASQKVLFSDPDMVKQLKRMSSVAVEGKGWSELLERADSVG